VIVNCFCYSGNDLVISDVGNVDKGELLYDTDELSDDVQLLSMMSAGMHNMRVLSDREDSDSGTN